ncbi:hypothetical protein J7426_18175 [Tropicibacter sp. R16_0]|uniref:lipase family protein n=1 Tax=Tropicibacter sp. R16_0 TaxID=2821102 RepID=UPI001ADC801F|nr:putative Ig domain-containing protein [Tropicibacter sp. R16_0]MBO9452206.1 hypothetical protein [Tropicibacter sp. R16_0]
MAHYSTIRKISVAPDGGRANDLSGTIGLNFDGSQAIVGTFATNLAPNDPNGPTYSVLNYDVESREFSYIGTASSIVHSHNLAFYVGQDLGLAVVDATTGASRDIAPRTPDDEEFDAPIRLTSVSDDGAVVAFWSRPTNFIDGFTSAHVETYVYDFASGDTELVSPGLGGAEPDLGISGAMLSGSGTFVAYSSSASNLVAGDTNGVQDVFLFNRLTDSLTLVSVAAGGGPANGPSTLLDISQNGQKIAFSSEASNLVSGDTNGLRDIFIYDVLSGGVTRIGQGLDGSDANGAAVGEADFSADGRFVTFTSSATNITADPNFAERVFVTDLVSNETAAVDFTYRGHAPNRDSGLGILSGDGSVIAFTSLATNLIENPARDSYWDTFLVDNPLLVIPNRAPVSTFTRGIEPSSDGDEISFDFGRFFRDPDGDTITYSISASLGAGSFPDNVDLQFDENTGVLSGTLNYFGPYVELPVTVTADDGQGGRTTASFDWQLSARDAPDTFLMEYVARETAYMLGDNIPLAGRLFVGSDVLDPNGNPTGYNVDEIWDVKGTGNDDTGFIAAGLVGDGLQPILAVRGTFSPIDGAFADTDPRGVGLTQFEAAWNATGPGSLRQWIEDHESQGINVSGHSLGGAQSQLVTAYASQAGFKIASVTTFNTPGISQTSLARFDDSLVGPVNHWVSSGDIVSMAGNAFLPGQVTLYDMTTFDTDTHGALAPLFYLLGAHTKKWSQIEVYNTVYNGSAPMTPGEPVVLGTVDAAVLGAADYNHLSNPANIHDEEFAAFLVSLGWAGDVVGSYTERPDLGGELVKSLLRRDDAEQTRQDIGEVIRFIEGSADVAVAVTNAVREELAQRLPSMQEILLTATLAPGRLLFNEFKNLSAEAITQIIRLNDEFWKAIDSITPEFITRLSSATSEFFERLNPFNSEAWKTVMAWTAAEWNEAAGWDGYVWETLGEWGESIWAELRKGPFETFRELAQQSLTDLQTLGSYGAALLAELNALGVSITSATINGLAGIPTAIAGSIFDDTSTGTEARESFDGGLGNDTITPGGGFDDIKLGAGNDLVRGTIEDLNGDRISDFTDDDQIELLGLLLELTDLKITLGSAVLDIDADGDGQRDATIILQGDFETDDIVLRHQGPNTIIETQGAANGTDQQGTAGANSIQGSPGNDTIDGLDGDDSLVGGLGDDLISGGGGSDTLIGGDGNDSIFGGDGFDYAFMDGQVDDAEVRLGTNGVFVSTAADGTDFISDDVERIVLGGKFHTFAEIEALAPAVIPGDETNNVIYGTADREIINGLAGHDWLVPGRGNDTVDGGSERDMVSYSDVVEVAGRGTAFMLDLDLGAGTAELFGGEIDQLISIERVTGTIFADVLRGSDGDDELRGIGDYDWFVATAGNDTLTGGNGLDMITFVEAQASGAPVFESVFSVDGAPPVGAAVGGVTLDLSDPSRSTGLASGLTLTSVERVTGSSHQDVFYGDAQQNDFRGLGGYDWFVGSTGGRERYFGGDGLDTVTYFQSTSGVSASLRNGAGLFGGQETGYGSAGDAVRDLYFEIENLVGTNFDDSLTGNNERNQLSGLDGDDFLFGYGGIDYLKGGAGNDTLNGGAGSDFALYDGNRSEYTLTRTSVTEVTVTHASGTDSLSNVEYFQFNDTTANIWDLTI